MSLVQVLGLAAAVLCLLAYARGGRLFDWANALLWPIVLTASLQAGAWGPALLNVGFGVVGVYHLIRHRRPPATRAQENAILSDLAQGKLYYRED